MNCSRELIEAYLDEELDASQRAAVERHLAGCPQCSEAHAGLQRQKADIKAAAPYFRTPANLRRSIREALERAAAERPKRPAREAPWRGLTIAASLLLLASVSWNVIQMRSRAAVSELADTIVTDHVRSLIGTHLLDVPSSDQHIVKPWFAGKLDFSPDVRDLSDRGFPLVGGRVEYFGGRRVAALVYQRRLHVINLFIWPAGPSGAETVISRKGYNLIHWTTGPMTYWAVSDVNAAELATLRDLYN
jgi:anti-sigma factor RsiW